MKLSNIPGTIASKDYGDNGAWRVAHVGMTGRRSCAEGYLRVDILLPGRMAHYGVEAMFGGEDRAAAQLAKYAPLNLVEEAFGAAA